MVRSSCALALITFLSTVGCVETDIRTGEVLPRGEQRYRFSEVEEKAEMLRVGMSKRDVLFLLGSPAEHHKGSEVWIYLPERPAYILPGRALRLEFEDGLLIKHGYHAIILGKQL